VTGFHAPEGEHRRHLAELESGLRDRLRALDEPVARADWQEVVRQARSPVRPLLAFAVITAVALALIAAAVFGFRSSPATHDALSQGSGAGGTLVSPTQQGGICYEWAGGTRSCASKAAPLGVAWGRDQVAGAVSLAGVSSVRIEFTERQRRHLPVRHPGRQDCRTGQRLRRGRLEQPSPLVFRLARLDGLFSALSRGFAGRYDVAELVVSALVFSRKV
jgi:hypothetical protein